MSFAECATNVWRKGLPGYEILGHVNFLRAQDLKMRTVGLQPSFVSGHEFLWTKIFINPFDGTWSEKHSGVDGMPTLTVMQWELE